MCVNTLDPVAGLSHEQQKDVPDQTVPPQPPAPPQAVNLPQPVNPPQSAAPANPPQPATPPSPQNVASPQNSARSRPTGKSAATSRRGSAGCASGKTRGNQEKSEKPGKQEIQKGGLIEAPRPIYPQEAKEKKVEGQVTVSIVIGEEGTVISARPTSGPDLLQGRLKRPPSRPAFIPR